MRLIDADEIKFTEYINGDVTVSKEKIDTQPTAYDIDKVVEELKNKLSEKKYQHEGDDYYVGICDAIEIVKQGVR